jgi:hypothetical protein
MKSERYDQWVVEIAEHLPYDFQVLDFKRIMGLYKYHQMTQRHGAHMMHKPVPKFGAAIPTTLSTHVAFVAGRVVITGDMAPRPKGMRNGIVSDAGYGDNTEWFSSALYPDYLCEKFLSKAYSGEAAWDDANDHVTRAIDQARWEPDGSNKDLRDLEIARGLLHEHRRMIVDNDDPDVLYDLLSPVIIDLWDLSPGFVYDPFAQVMLFAAQLTFGRLIRGDYCFEPEKRA